MAFLGPNNALAWAHFRLRGGWKRSLTFTLGAAALLIMLIIGATRLDPNRSRTLFSWTSALLGLQGACLVLYVPGRISAAIRQDIQSKLIESHRLMPTPPVEAVIGYITGAAMQPLVFSTAIFVIGAFTAQGAGVALSRWAFANAILLAFAAFVWILGSYAAFGARFGPALLFMPFFIAPYMSDGGGFALLPGVLVLLSPVFGNSIFDMRVTGLDLPATYAMAFATHVYFGGICLTAAARRYRSSDSIGMSSILGLLLVAGWTGITAIALREWDDFRPRGGWLRDRDITLQAQLIASMAAGMLLALGPVAAIAWERVRWRRHRALRDPAPMQRPLPAIAVIAVAAAFVTLITLAPPIGAKPSATTLLLTFYIITVSLAGLYFLYDWIYSARAGAGFVAFAWLLLAWGLPIVIDSIRYGLADFGEAEPVAGIACCSPIGALIVIWDHRPVDPKPGLIMMLLINAVPLLLWLMLMIRRRARKIPALG